MSYRNKNSLRRFCVGNAVSGYFIAYGNYTALFAEQIYYIGILLCGICRNKSKLAQLTAAVYCLCRKLCALTGEKAGLPSVFALFNQLAIFFYICSV